MKKILLVFLLTGMISLTQLNAQVDFFSVQYSIGFGTGDMSEFIEKTSWRGVSFEYRSFVTPNVGVGIESGVNTFYEKKDYATYTEGTRSLSGTQYRYINTVPILAAVDYYFQPDAQINPFLGLGIGTIYNRRDLDMGLYTIEEEAWQFALRPELGVLFNVSEGLDLMLAAKYYAGFRGGDLDAQNYFTINLGLNFK
jgi:outer membrane protein W